MLEVPTYPTVISNLRCSNVQSADPAPTYQKLHDILQHSQRCCMLQCCPMYSISSSYKSVSR